MESVSSRVNRQDQSDAKNLGSVSVLKIGVWPCAVYMRCVATGCPKDAGVCWVVK